MDVPRVERIARDIIAEYGFPCDLVAVHDRDGHWQITVRDHTRRIIELDIASRTPAQTRELLVARLDHECPAVLPKGQ